MTDFINSQLTAAIVGALIAFFPAYGLSVLQENKKASKEYQTWLRGLIAELKHIKGCIIEITSIVQDGNPSTKRMNSDFIQQARLMLFSLETDSDLLERLTTAYRDIVHTNDMLDRYEKKAENKHMIQPNVLASMKGVESSIDSLDNLITTKLPVVKTSLPSSLFWIRVGLLTALSITIMLIATSKDEVNEQAKSVPIPIWPVNPDKFEEEPLKNMARAVQENTERVSGLIAESEGQKAIERLLGHPWLFWFVLLTPLLAAMLMAAERIATDWKK